MAMMDDFCFLCLLAPQEPIPKGAFVMQYVGEVIPRAVMDGRSRQEARRGYHNYCMEAVGEERDLDYDWAAPCIDSLVRLEIYTSVSSPRGGDRERERERERETRIAEGAETGGSGGEKRRHPR